MGVGLVCRVGGGNNMREQLVGVGLVCRVGGGNKSHIFP